MANIDINLSQRAAQALRPLLMPINVRWFFLDIVKSSETFEVLPNWAKDIIRFGEQFTSASETSVPVPEHLIPPNAPEKYAPNIDSSMRYWKYADTTTGQVYRIFRIDDNTKRVEMYMPPWVNAIDWYESLIMDPSYVEISDFEAQYLLSRFQSHDTSA